MKIRMLASVFPLVLVIASVALAQPKDEHKLVQFQMAILKKGPQWDSTKPEDRNSILKQHLGNVIELLNSGKAVIAGPFGDETHATGIFVFRTASADEAKSLLDADPGVKAGLLIGELHPWWSEDI